jgi:O-antigen/teichoic acid export membrane protein
MTTTSEPEAPGRRRAAGWRSGVHSLAGDHLIRGSAMLMLSAGATAALGFVFWIIVAHVYTPAQVGIATSLSSAISVLSYFSLFGLNGSLVRFLPTSNERDAMISRAILVVGLVAAVIGTVYLLGVPWYAPRLAFVVENPVMSVLFVVFTVCAGVNLLTDSIFVALRRAEYNAVVDGLVQGAAKLAVPGLLVVWGSFGIVTAVGVGCVSAVVASLWVMHRKLGVRVRLRGTSLRLRSMTGYSTSSYVASALNLLPTMILPIVVLDARGPEDTGYYYVAFQIAFLLYAVAYAAGEAVFAEGSYADSEIRTLLRRGARLLLLLQGPAALLTFTVSGLLLGVFSSEYADRAGPLLQVLALGAVTVSLNSWAGSALRILKRMTSLTVMNAIYCASIVGLAVLWVDHGLVWVGVAWVVGNGVSGVYGAAVLWWTLRRPEPRLDQEAAASHGQAEADRPSPSVR